MSELGQLQEQFQRFLLSGDLEIYDAIEQTESVSVNTRLRIYQDAYGFRLIESLIANFPRLYIYLGTEKFNRLAQAYLRAYPSSYRSIRWFGDVLPVFVRDYYQQDPYLAELADLEWKMTLAFDAADVSRVSIADMSAILPESWPNLQFVLHPSVQWGHYFWNTVSLWQALTDGQELPGLHYQPEATTWILWRSSELIIQFCSLSHDEAWALNALAQGSSFAVLCEGLCQRMLPETVGMQAASYLKGWIQRGILSQLLMN